MIKFDSQSKNTPEAREKRKPLLNFSRSSEKDRLTGMPLLALIYPSVFLATKYDPLLLFKERDAPLLNVAEAVAYFEKLILKALEPLTSDAVTSGPEDETWYWAAPILLDRLEYPRETKEWWNNESLASIWSGESENQEKDKTEDETNSAWSAHVEEARKVALSTLRPQGRPPQDLAIVLAQIALASPAVSSLRALARVAAGNISLGNSILRNKAGALGWAFRSLFNTPENTSLIRGNDAREPYWRRVLEYCVNGNLQSTLDEYAHVLKDLAARVDGSPMEIVEDISSALSKATSIRIAQPGADRIWVDDANKKVMIKKERLRSRFAMRYGDEQADDGRMLFRADSVRQAFNSPFWPFVLITTSVGQEGLDFHPYCHAVVHWNLPSNPVDLEQREGRVHRFKGHAVRRNIAIHFGRELNLNVLTDPWQEMFEAAETIAEDKQGLNPFWVFPIKNGAVIERHVMALPLSREAARLPALRKSLAVYRMVFGQPRQDDLLSYLMAKMPRPELIKCLEQIKIDLSP